MDFVCMSKGNGKYLGNNLSMFHQVNRLRLNQYYSHNSSFDLDQMYTRAPPKCTNPILGTVSICAN